MREYELFKQATLDRSDSDRFYDHVRKAALSPDTSDNELSAMLNRYDIQSHFGLSIIKDIIDKLIEQHRLHNLSDSIHNYINDVAIRKNIRPIEFIFELTISNNGATRIIGRKLIDSFNVTPDELNVITYSEEQQIKCLISLTQDWVSGEKRIPLIMATLESDSVKVRQCFLIVMQTYSLNYYGLIVKYLRKHRFRRTKEFQIYKKFLKSLEHRFDTYHNCPELYSEYYFPDIFEETKRSEIEYMQDIMDIQDQKHKAPFLELVPLIALGRGGGWRQPDGTVQPLAKIAVSTTAPMLLSAQSPFEEHIQSINIYSNWNSANEL